MGARLAADIGGTFTDVVLEIGARRFSAKVLTTIDGPERGVADGVDAVLAEAGVDAADVELFIHGTTLATNALIERKGAVTALLTTAGFRDVLATGYEKRFDQNSVFLDLPEPLVPRRLRFTVPERISARGEVLLPLDEAAVNRLASELAAQGVQALAIGFIHAYAFPQHERRAAELLQAALPELRVSSSSEVCPEMREYERFSTTCANAYVQPLLSGYLYRLRDDMNGRGLCCPLLLMTSGGGLTPLEQAARLPIRLVESGPAGGAMLAAHVAAQCALDKVLSFDMGGTTAKICLLENGRPERARRFEVARMYRHMKGSGLPLRIPVIEMVEIGAGGGSIARVDELQRINVGPDSAGSQPGPVCYGRGGTAATVTDSNLVLNRLDPDYFAGGKLSLDSAGAAAALAQQVGRAAGLEGFWPAAGVVEIVDENMANAARVHAIERGKIIGDQTLIAFGGGAPLHAARLAAKLGIRRIVVPTGAGVGSAIGFLRAPVAYEVVRSFSCGLAELPLRRVNELLKVMSAEAEAVVVAAAGGVELSERRSVDVRYSGQGHEISLPLPSRPLEKPDLALIRETFEARYRAKYGLIIEHQALEAVTWSITLGTVASACAEPTLASSTSGQPATASRRAIYDATLGDWADAAVYRRSELAAGMSLAGPALIAEDETSTWVPSGFALSVDARGYLIIEQSRA